MSSVALLLSGSALSASKSVPEIGALLDCAAARSNHAPIDHVMNPMRCAHLAHTVFTDTLCASWSFVGLGGGFLATLRTLGHRHQNGYSHGHY
jgi:hypothetical protein